MADGLKNKGVWLYMSGMTLVIIGICLILASVVLFAASIIYRRTKGKKIREFLAKEYEIE